MAITLVALVGLFLTCLPACSSPELPTAQSSLTSNDYSLVTRVKDGDTIVIANGSQEGLTVRYIGIDTPPIRAGKELNKAVKRTGKDKELIKKLGQEASEANRKLVAGKKVSLEYGVQNDPFKRTLAYVWLEDGTFVNAWLVENGFARVSTYPPNVKYQEKFLTLERKAREAEKGLWERR